MANRWDRALISRTNAPKKWRGGLLAMSALGSEQVVTDNEGAQTTLNPNGYGLQPGHLAALYVRTGPSTDGRAMDPAWACARRTPRFVDMLTCTPAPLDTTANARTWASAASHPPRNRKWPHEFYKCTPLKMWGLPHIPDRLSGHKPRGPGPLEIIPAQPAGHIDAFADEIQPRHRL